MKNKRTIGIPMDDEMIDAVKTIAAQNERTMAAQIRFWVDEALRKEFLDG